MKPYEIFNDHFQNYKVYGIPKAQLVIADIPYNVGKNAYGSNPMWYKGGGTIRTVRANWPVRSSLTLIRIFALLSLCTSAVRCLLRSQRSQVRHPA